MSQIPVTNGSCCPNCGKKFFNKNPSGFFYGSPIRFCKKCKGAYIDKNYHEIAIDGFPPTEVNIKTGLKIALIGLIMTVVCGGIFFTEITYSFRYHTVFPAMSVMGIVLVIIGIIESIRVKTGLKAKAMEKLRQESIQRLKDPKYALQLKELGYNVPEEFLPQGYEQQMSQSQQPDVNGQLF